MSSTVDPNYQPPPGRVGNLNEQQEAALKQFKKEVQDEGLFDEKRHDDATLLRFLRARKFDVNQTKTMFKNYEKWRKDFGVEDITHNFHFDEKKKVDEFYPQFYHKTDKDGRPVYIERLGRLDVKKLYNVTTPQRQLQNLVLEYERMLNDRFPACSAQVHHPVETSCTILDLSGVGIMQFYKVKDTVLAATNIGQNYYPETMGKFYIINAPYLFSTVWGLIKPWLDEVTVKKIDIPGSDYKAKLLEQIPAENLPKDLGGTCSCSGGCSLSDAGPWNNKSGSTSGAPVAAS